MANKRYYWLKLMKDFFVQARIKKLRRIAGGDTYVIIYLKLMLLSINTDGVITFESIEDTIEEELALILDEEIDNIKVVLAYLMANNLCHQISNNEYDFTEVQNLIGSETASAERVRKHRINKQKVLHCNNDVTDVKQLETKSNTEKESESYEEEKEEEKLNYFEEFYIWLPKPKKFRTDKKWHKQKIKNNLLVNDKQTLENYKSFINELQSNNLQKTTIDASKQQFELLQQLMSEKTPNEIYSLNESKEYQDLFTEDTSNFIHNQGGLVELRSKFEDENNHAWLFQQLYEEY